MNWFTNKYPRDCNHELNLDFILTTYKDMLEEWFKTKIDWKNLKDFVDSYFDKLDLSDEVETIIRQLISDGYIQGLITAMSAYRVNVVNAGVDNTGATDTSVALNNLFANGGAFYLPAGVYLLENQLVIPSNCDIKGSGLATILKASDNLDAVYHTVCSKNASDINARLCCNIAENGYPDVSILGDYDENIKLSDLVIDGNWRGRDLDTWNKFYEHDGYSIAREPGTNLEFQKCRNVTFENVIAMNGIQHNINVRGGAYSFNKGIDYEALYPSYNIRIVGCSAINERYDDCITTHDSYDIIIEDCYCNMSNNKDGTYSQAVSNGIEIDDGSRFVTVKNCTTDYAVCGFQAKGHDNTPPAHDVVFDGCTARYTQYGFSLSCGPSSDYIDDISAVENRNNNIKIVNCSVLHPYRFDNVSSWQHSRIFVAMKNSSNVIVENLYIDANEPTRYEVDNLDLATTSRTLFNFRESNYNITFNNVKIAGDIVFDYADAGLFQIAGNSKNITLHNIAMEGCSGAPIIKYNRNDFYSVFDVQNFIAKQTSEDDVFFQFVEDGVAYNNKSYQWSRYRQQGKLDMKYYNVFNGGYVMSVLGGYKELNVDQLIDNDTLTLIPYGGINYLLKHDCSITLTNREYIRYNGCRFVNNGSNNITLNISLATQPAFMCTKTLSPWQSVTINVDANGGVTWL